jgi:hypothetical protein
MRRMRVMDADGEGKKELVCVVCADLNGDGKVDIIGIGRGTKYVKVCWNEGKRR